VTVPTVVVVKGDERARINESDLRDWQAKGFEPLEAEKKAEGFEPLEAEKKAEGKKAKKAD